MKILLCGIFSATAFAQNTDLMNEAQKAYVAGKWKEAASAYKAACAAEPKQKQAECLLWNVLALSQIGDGNAFKEAGKRLDSLIRVVNPQESLYADLMMTSAQFKMYLGKYNEAADALIHAIETSKPHHHVVLQKVCQAIMQKSSSETLRERCQNMGQPLPADKPAQAQAEPIKEQPKEQPKELAKEQQKELPKEAVKELPREQAKEHWVLQVGAFGVKDNATLLVSTLKMRKISADIIEQPREDKTLYLVQTGHFKSQEEAIDYGAKVLSPLKVEYQPLLRK
ncbi:MAG: SPOR domain-containing protein [Fibrobacter sp.]|nr:SPOR domain-containing protein [Fibrobacter sp.]